MLRKDGGFTISGRRSTRTGHLDRRAFLHKRYQIQRVIGQGGMGAVYLAKDLKEQGRLCAIKEMSLSMVDPADQPQAIQNFKIEAKILWGLDHPNLPKLIGFFEQNQRYYLVMEYIHGETLEDMLERSGAPFPERRVLGWARQLCDVLMYLHSQKPPIIFRDMKPGNIMLMREGQIKLIDFGIARFFRPTYAPDTQILGTPGYAPPEQYGKSQTDERSDIYALGMTLFHLLTNTLSEYGFGLERVYERYPRISPMLARALEKATELKPDERYQTVEEFHRALFGVSTFVFVSGEEATSPEELAELAQLYPEESAEYLQNGEIEAWLRDLEEEDFAQVAHYLKDSPEPMEAIAELIQVILNKNSYGSRPSQSGPTTSSRHSKPPISNLKISSPDLTVSQSGGNRPRITPPPRTTPIHVSPGVLDFGSVYPGISSPLNISIRGSHGYTVNGVLYTTDPWIQLSRKEYDGILTDVGVRINTRNLQQNTRYTGKITVIPADDEQPDIVVKVAADVQTPPSGRRNPQKTNGADLDDDDYDYQDEELDAILADGLIGPYDDAQPYTDDLDAQSDDERKYATYDPSTGLSRRFWEMASTTPLQRLWQKRVMTGSAAFMCASLAYTLLSHLRPVPLPPQPSFILVLTAMVPAAALGALIVQWERRWSRATTVNRGLTALAGAFASLTLFEGLWQLLIRPTNAPLQLFIMLVVVACGATLGILKSVNAQTSQVIQRLQRTLHSMYWFKLALASIIGGGLGYFLTMGFPFTFFTFFGILLGVSVVVSLVLHVTQVPSPQPLQQTVKQTTTRRQRV